MKKNSEPLLIQLILCLYEVATALCAPIVGLLFLFHPRGRTRLSERFGVWNLEGQFIWFHGASRGEVLGLIPIIQVYKEKFPETRILVTSTSPTGLLHLPSSVDENRLLPFDCRFFLRLALRNVRIVKTVIGETEIWPALLTEMNTRKAPVYFVNAKISAKTERYYQSLRRVLRPLLNRSEGIFAANEDSMKRFHTLGVDKEIIFLVGDAKYDRTPAIRDPSEKRDFSLLINPQQLPTLALGSIRPSEFYLWKEAIAELVQKRAQVLIVIAPRHAEKFEYFASELSKETLSFQRWTEIEQHVSASYDDNQTVQLLLLNTIGKLEHVYAVADLSFIGASLTPGMGGHNPLEAMAYGSCTLMGPYRDNVRELVEDAMQNQAMCEVSNKDEIRRYLSALITRDETLRIIGANGKRFWQARQGVAAAIVERITRA